MTAPLATENLVAARDMHMDGAEISPADTLADTPAQSVQQPAPSAALVPPPPKSPKGASEIYGKHHPGSGNARNPNQYFGQLMSWMNKHKHYPPALKKKKQAGVVEVQFTIGRDGELLDASIAKSCGNSALDEAALQMMTDAAPFPPIPGFINQAPLTLVIPVEYSLITNAVN